MVSPPGELYWQDLFGFLLSNFMAIYSIDSVNTRVTRKPRILNAQISNMKCRDLIRSLAQKNKTGELSHPDPELDAVHFLIDYKD